MKLEFEQVVPVHQGELFAFFEKPAHLRLLHQGQPCFRLLHHDSAVHVGGATWFEITVAGLLPVVLGFRHTLYDPPQCFGAQLIHGPFHRFSHIHLFEGVTAGARVRDFLEVELPLQYGGEAAVRSLVAPLLRQAFLLRRDALARLVQDGQFAR